MGVDAFVVGKGGVAVVGGEGEGDTQGLGGKEEVERLELELPLEMDKDAAEVKEATVKVEVKADDRVEPETVELDVKDGEHAERESTVNVNQSQDRPKGDITAIPRPAEDSRASDVDRKETVERDRKAK